MVFKTESQNPIGINTARCSRSVFGCFVINLKGIDAQFSCSKAARVSKKKLHKSKSWRDVISIEFFWSRERWAAFSVSVLVCLLFYNLAGNLLYAVLRIRDVYSGSRIQHQHQKRRGKIFLSYHFFVLPFFVAGNIIKLEKNLFFNRYRTLF
jgi:hypothetical protein